MLSKTSIDRIGERIRKEGRTVETIPLLSEYQKEFYTPYKKVERILTEKMRLEITGRPIKSFLSTQEKLNRIKSRLSQVQDISGCRSICYNLSVQDEIISSAKSWFKDLEIDDKRESPTNNYRAVHLIAKIDGRPIEIQIRTTIQHFWASISESLADRHGQEIKYGKGNKKIISLLERLSEACRDFDIKADIAHQYQAELYWAKKFKAPQNSIKDIKKNLTKREEALRHSMYKTRAILSEMDE